MIRRFLLAVLCLGLLTACGTTSGGSSGSSPAPASSTPDTVVIDNFMFAPMSLTVAAGAKVTVRNDDSATHTLTASDKSFDTGDIAPGKSATFTAPAKPGSYSYICDIHQYMQGTLVVR